MAEECAESLTVRERVRRGTLVHHVDDQGRLYLTHGRRIICQSGTQRTWLGTFPRMFPRDLFGFCRLSQRAARSDKCNVYVNQQQRILGIRGETVYAVDPTGLRPLQTIQGDCVLHDSFAEDLHGWTYFGEYFRNPQRGPVRIWRVDPELKSCEIAHEFPAGEIRHVHGVYRDPFDPQALWISVGDLKDECYVLRTDDRFRSLHWFGDGTQKWRAVKLFFTPQAVTWITDSNLEQNYACRMDRSTGNLEVGQKIDCSGWYGFQTERGEFVAGTTVEAGPGILSSHSSILVSRDGFHWHVAYQFQKDLYRPMRVFKFGVINFPSGQLNLEDFYLSGEGLQGLDGRILRVSLTVPETHAIPVTKTAGQPLRLDRATAQTARITKRAG